VIKVARFWFSRLGAVIKDLGCLGLGFGCLISLAFCFAFCFIFGVFGFLFVYVGLAHDAY